MRSAAVASSWRFGGPIRLVAAANQPLKVLPTSLQPGGENVAHLASLEARKAAEDSLIQDSLQPSAYQSPSAAGSISSDKGPIISARGTSPAAPALCLLWACERTAWDTSSAGYQSASQLQLPGGREWLLTLAPEERELAQ